MSSVKSVFSCHSLHNVRQHLHNTLLTTGQTVSCCRTSLRLPCSHYVNCTTYLRGLHFDARNVCSSCGNISASVCFLRRLDNHNRSNKKRKAIPLQALSVLGGWGSHSAILTLGWEAQYLGGSQSRSRSSGKEENLLPLAGFEAWTVSQVAYYSFVIRMGENRNACRILMRKSEGKG
jgi:hypothetical protein